MTVANRGRCSVTCKPGLAGGDRLELAADAVRRVGLHVERVEVRRPAELVQEDDVLGPRRSRRGVCSALKSEGSARPGDPRRARLEQAAA